jgi:hypothetical protein
MSTSILRNSRLNLATLMSVDGVEFWDMVDLPAYPTNKDDIKYQVTSSDRIDLMANRYYSDPSLWWVIAWANDMEIFPTDLNVGEIIIIPSTDYVKTRLFRTK